MVQAIKFNHSPTAAINTDHVTGEPREHSCDKKPNRDAPPPPGSLARQAQHAYVHDDLFLLATAYANLRNSPCLRYPFCGHARGSRLRAGLGLNQVLPSMQSRHIDIYAVPPAISLHSGH